MIPPSYAWPAWNKLLVCGVPSPGVVRLSGHVRTIGWDVKDASGQDGGTTTRKGKSVGKFTAEFELSDDPMATDFAEWDSFEALLMTSISGTEPEAMEVIHPDLQRNGFSAVVLAQIGEMIPDGTGGARIKVDFIEYAPPKPKATGAAGKPKGTTETDPRVDEAEKAMDEAKKAGEGLW